MKGRGGATQTLEYLEERVRFLEEANRNHVSILEMLASSGDFHGDLSRAKDSLALFRATANQVKRILPCRCTGCFETMQDGSFELRTWDPAESHTEIDAEIDAKIMDGTFAWALNRNQAILSPLSGERTLLLHVIATRSQVCGMFAAILPGNSTSVSTAALSALSIVLYICAYAHESMSLNNILHDHMATLEERVLERTRDLAAARELAEAANRAKSAFLANMSHEIRTPMNGVMGMTELLLGGKYSPQMQQYYLNAIKDSADSLMIIINDLLDLSKIEAGKLTLNSEPFDLRTTVGQVLRALSARGIEKGLDIVFFPAPRIPERLVGDQYRLRQVLMNLVGNAVKFSDKGEIIISVTEDSRDAESIILRFTVRDCGIGIEFEALDRIFNEFEQADVSTTKKFGGTGLGLAICRRLVDMMGGEIGAESEPGKGSTFHFTIRATLPDDGQEDPDTARLLGVHAFVVESSGIHGLTLADYLSGLGLTPHLSSTAGEALHKIAELAIEPASPLVILLDANLSDVDIHLLRDIDSAHEGAHVVLMSQAGYGNDEGKAATSSGVRHLTKPLIYGELRETLLDALSSKQHPRSDQLAGPERQASLKVLLVDDVEINRLLAASLLQSRGHCVTTCDNGRQAIEVFSAGAFDIVLMDVQMPVMDGIQATAEIRRIESIRGGHTPILALTAYASREDEAKFSAAGMDGFLSKPFKANELFSALSRLCTERDEAAAEGSVPHSGEVDLCSAASIFDRDALLSRLGGKEELIPKFISLFRKGTDEHLGKLRKASSESDQEAVRVSAHAIKGAAANIGALRVQEVAGRMEAEAKKGVAEALSLLSLLMSEYGKFMDAYGEGVE